MKRSFYCNALQGNSDYNICINSDMTVSCNCQDYDGSGQIGDLTTQTFQEIFEGDIAQEFRRMLVGGKLPVRVCRGCSELREIEGDAEPSRYLLGFHIPKFGIMVENTIACNLKCLCCRRDDLLKTRKRFNMSLEDLEKVSKTVRDNKIGKVHFFSLGEPFISQTVLEEIGILREYNPFLQVHTSTNGMLLNDEKKIRAALMMNHIYFSIDGSSHDSVTKYQIGGNFYCSYENMKNLVKARSQAGLDSPTIEWKYVVFSWNDSAAEVERAIELAKEAGIDVISFWLGGGPPSFISHRFLNDPYFQQLGDKSWKGREIHLREIPHDHLIYLFKRLNHQEYERYLDQIRKGEKTMTDACLEAIEGDKEMSHREFVERSYRIFLGRAPEGEGLEGYTRELECGNMTRAQLVLTLVHSDEFRQKASLKNKNQS